MFRNNRKATAINFNNKIERTWVEENFHIISKISHPALLNQTPITDTGIEFSDGIKFAMDLTRRMAKILSINMRQVVVCFSGGLSSAASVQREGIDYFIEIDQFFQASRHQIAACLSHEISHVFLKDNNLEIYSGDANERYTDLMTICLGMGTLLLNGLSKCEKVTIIDQVKKTETRGVKPYLSKQELGYGMALYVQAKSLKNEEVEKELNDDGALSFNMGLIELQTRRDEIIRSKEFEKAIVTCPICFQKLRITVNAGDQDVICGNCKRKTRYNTDCLLDCKIHESC